MRVSLNNLRSTQELSVTHIAIDNIIYLLLLKLIHFLI